MPRHNGINYIKILELCSADLREEYSTFYIETGFMLHYIKM